MTDATKAAPAPGLRPVDPKTHALNKYAAGLVAGSASTILGYPLDVARVRILFSSQSGNTFNGLTFSLLFSMAKSSLVWPIQKSLQEEAEKRYHPGLLLTVATGACGNVIPTIICTPGNVVKVRYMQTNVKQSFSEIVSNAYKEGGLKSFLHGASATIIRDLVWGAIYFPMFPQILQKSKTVLGERKYGAAVHETVAATTSAAAATLFSSVFDSVRLHQQRSGGEFSHAFMPALKDVLTLNWRNFSSIAFGIGRVSVTTAIAQVTFLRVMHFLEGDNGHR